MQVRSLYQQPFNKEHLTAPSSKLLTKLPMMSYFSGLSFNQGTKPGFKKTSEKYGVSFDGVDIECENVSEPVWRTQDAWTNYANNLKNKYETCYNWSEVIGFILGNLELFYDPAAFKDDLEDEIKDWLGSVDGWGLLFTLLPFKFQKNFLLMYSHIKMNHQQEDDISSEDLFDKTKTMYETDRNIPFSDLVPKVEAELLHIVGGPTEHERRRMLLVKFNSSKFKLIAKFYVDKKRLRRTLVEIAAEVVGQMVEDSEDLEIPETLKEVVEDKIIDADWVSDYWLAKSQNKIDTRRVSTYIHTVM